MRPTRSLARVALLVLLTGALAACATQPATDAGAFAGSVPATTAPGTTIADPADPAADPATVDVDTPFCVALHHFLDVGADVSSATPSASPTGNLTPEQMTFLDDTYLPAITELQAATPAEMRGALDFLARMLTSLTLPADDPGRNQVLVDLLGGGAGDYDTFEAFMTFATESCRLDDDQVDALHTAIGAPANPAEACQPARADEPTIADEDRLLTVEDVTAIDAFELNCPRIPTFSAQSPTPSGHGPCGGDLPIIDSSSGPGASYGIGFSKVVEVLARPGSVVAAQYLEALASTTTTGCPSTSATAADGTTSTISEVVVVDLPGIVDPHVAYTAHISADAAFGSQTGIPIEMEVAFVAVQHDDELLILVATEQDPIPADDFDELAAAATMRARW